MYHGKIKVERYRKKVKYKETHQLPNELFTLDTFRKYVSEDELFDIWPSDEYVDVLFIEVYKVRMETDEEMEKRIAKQEKYMENYHRFHAKYDKS